MKISPRFTVCVLGGAAALFLASLLFSCGGGGSLSITEPEEGFRGITAFRQHVPAEDGRVLYFPEHAGVWDFNEDFSICDGGYAQFDNGLRISIGGEGFPNDQTFPELTFLEPVFTADNGILPAAVADASYAPPISGLESAYLNTSNSARLSQILDLTGAVAPVTVKWSDRILLDWTSMDPGDSYYRVVIRNADTLALLNVLHLRTQTAYDPLPVAERSFDLSNYAGHRILLSFEERSCYHQKGATAIDDVSVTDAAHVEYVANGDFESGDLSGWTSWNLGESQNIQSAERTIAGVTVKRSVYTPPGSVWARWTDTITNPSANPVVTDVVLTSGLGAAVRSIIHEPVAGQAVDVWDGDGLTRDIGFVYGSGFTLQYTSASSMGAVDADRFIYARVTDLTIEPGETVSFVTFALTNGVVTGQTAQDASETAEAISTAAAHIVAHFHDDPEYTRGIPADVLPTILNF